jgi:hypothetical protein
MQTKALVRFVLNGIVQALAAGLIGLFGLPLLFGSVPDPVRSELWLGAAIAVCVWLLAPTRVLAAAMSEGLTKLLGRAGERVTATHQATFELARLTVAVGYLVLLQAIVRRPLVAVLGSGAEPFLVEAVFAVVALLALLVLLAWIYRTAKPLIEGVAWTALDAALATTMSEAATRTAMAPKEAAATVTALEPAAATVTALDTTVTRVAGR